MRTPLRVARACEQGEVIIAGDHTATASSQGAMISGRRAADGRLQLQVVESTGVRPSGSAVGPVATANVSAAISQVT